MPMYGDPSSIVGITLELRAMGPTRVVVGSGICGLVGQSIRGPANQVTVIGAASDAGSLYYGGALKEGIETAIAQGCPVILVVRVLGTGAAKSEYDLVDGASPGVAVGTLKAASEGIWGDQVTADIEDGDFDQTSVENFKGDGTIGPYALKHWDYVESTANVLKVAGAAYTVVYSAVGQKTKEVYLNKATGEITFFTGEVVTTSQYIFSSLRYKTRKITLSDGENELTYNNIVDLVDLTAKLTYSPFATFEADPAATHLPKTGIYQLANGDDGDPVTTTNYQNALELIGEYITPPTTVALCEYEVATGTNDLAPILEAFTNTMAHQFKPCIGFFGMKPNATLDEVIDLCSNFDNMNFCIVANAWDKSNPRQNLAIARAAKEAAVALGESCAKDINAINGCLGLLNDFKNKQHDAFFLAGADSIHKKLGLLPYVGISTARAEQFKRTVDVRTVNWVIQAIKYITDQYYFERRTPDVLTAIQSSVEIMLQEQVEKKNITKFYVEVMAHPTDVNKVKITLMMENVGHIERFDTVMYVGIISNTTSSQ